MLYHICQAGRCFQRRPVCPDGPVALYFLLATLASVASSAGELERRMQDERRLEAERERRLRTASKIVVKVGTATVTGPEGDLCVERVGPIVRSIADLMKSGRRVVLVSSGAVGLGRAWLELHPSRLGDLVTKQACAAVGQSLLMEAYKRLFSAWSIKVAVCSRSNSSGPRTVTLTPN